MKNNKNITVVGSGYVGMSIAVLLAQKNNVSILDICKERVETINNGNSTISDSKIEEFLKTKDLNLTGTINTIEAFEHADIVIIATPTNYDSESNSFDTSSVDSSVSDALEYSNNASIIIKSTIPVGHTKSLQLKHKTDKIFFSPEFLREGRALEDNLFPSRIIVGAPEAIGKTFAFLLEDAAIKKSIDVLFMPSTEAEAVKLFANTYLAMRISFFNELDSYSMKNSLEAKHIIEGISLDSRIGSGYNNPSFGYGGYCLPKDTKQLLANFGSTPQSIIGAIIESNSVRKKFISNKILERKPKLVGFYRLIMKEGSDNFRSSAIQAIISRVSKSGAKGIIYEPSLLDKEFNGLEVVNDLNEFKYMSDLIVANRLSNELNDVHEKVFTRDIYGVD